MRPLVFSDLLSRHTAQSGVHEEAMCQDDLNLKLTKSEIAEAFADADVAARFPPVMTAAQAADLAQVPLNTLYQWRSRGLLTGCSRKVGKYVRFFRDRFIQKLFNEGLTSK